MKSWEGFWQIVLLVSVVGFAILAIVVTLGGLSDIRAMLSRVARRHSESESRQQPDTDDGQQPHQKKN